MGAPPALRVHVTSVGLKGTHSNREALGEPIAVTMEHVAAPVPVFSMVSSADARAAPSGCEAGCLSPLTDPRRG